MNVEQVLGPEDNEEDARQRPRPVRSSDADIMERMERGDFFADSEELDDQVFDIMERYPHVVAMGQKFREEVERLVQEAALEVGLSPDDCEWVRDSLCRHLTTR